MFQRRAIVKKIAAYAVLTGSVVLFSACSEPTKSAFSGIDLTGADYAQGFTLPDHNGQTRSLTDFKGKVVVVFFGYTQCPDVCPTSLTELAETKRLLGPQAERLQGLFISVDPERDTPEVMKAYMASFDPSFLALHATPEQLKTLAQSYKVYYKKVEGKTPTSYTMDHSAGSYVYDPQGRLRLYHRYGSGAPALAGDIKTVLAEKR
jgi:protein SCO1/2